MGRHFLAHDGARTGNKVDHAARHTCFDQYLDQTLGCLWHKRGRLKDHSIAVGQGRRNFPSWDGNWEIPWRNNTHYTEWLTLGEQQLILKITGQNIPTCPKPFTPKIAKDIARPDNFALGFCQSFAFFTCETGR